MSKKSRSHVTYGKQNAMGRIVVTREYLKPIPQVKFNSDWDKVNLLYQSLKRTDWDNVTPDDLIDFAIVEKHFRYWMSVFNDDPLPYPTEAINWAKYETAQPIIVEHHAGGRNAETQELLASLPIEMQKRLRGLPIKRK